MEEHDIQFLDVERDSTIHTKLDYASILFRQIERIMLAAHQGITVTYIDNIENLSMMLSPYTDKLFEEDKKEIKKRVKLTVGNMGVQYTEAGKITDVEKEAAKDMFIALMKLMARKAFLPPESIVDIID